MYLHSRKPKVGHVRKFVVVTSGIDPDELDGGRFVLDAEEGGSLGEFWPGGVVVFLE